MSNRDGVQKVLLVVLLMCTRCVFAMDINDISLVWCMTFEEAKGRVAKGCAGYVLSRDKLRKIEDACCGRCCDLLDKARERKIPWTDLFPDITAEEEDRIGNRWSWDLIGTFLIEGLGWRSRAGMYREALEVFVDAVMIHEGLEIMKNMKQLFPQPPQDQGESGGVSMEGALEIEIIKASERAAQRVNSSGIPPCSYAEAQEKFEPRYRRLGEQYRAELVKFWEQE